MQNFKDFALKNPYAVDQESETEELPASPDYSYRENEQHTDSPNFYDLSPLRPSAQLYALPEQQEPLSPPDSCITRFPHRNLQKISGVHEKYLNEELSPLTKTSFRSERKTAISKRLPLTQRLAQKNDPAFDLAVIYGINPINEGLKGLQINRHQLQAQLQAKLDREEERCSCFFELGLKQPKVLGKARSVRESNSIMAFLQNGEMPAEYVSSFLTLMGN